MYFYWKKQIFTWQYAIPTSCFPHHADATNGGRSAPMTIRLPSTMLKKYGVRSYCWNEGLVKIRSDRNWRAHPMTAITATQEARPGYIGVGSVGKYIGNIYFWNLKTFCYVAAKQNENYMVMKKELLLLLVLNVVVCSFYSLIKVAAFLLWRHRMTGIGVLLFVRYILTQGCNDVTEIFCEHAQALLG